MTVLPALGDAPAVAAPRTETEQQARLQRIVDEQYRLAWRLLRRLGVGADGVDDATQQVFLVVAERLADIQQASERSFVFGTALRVAQTLRRRRDREPASDQGELLACQWPAPDELADQKRARELLDAILEQMPLELRTVFVLFELEGLSSPEIADVALVPLGTVASRLRRARETFRELVARASAKGGRP